MVTATNEHLAVIGKNPRAVADRIQILRMETQQTGTLHASQSMHSMKISPLQPHAVRAVATFVFLLAGLLALPAAAQETPRIAVSGAYSFMRFDSRPLGYADYSNLQGVSGSVTYNFADYFGVALDVGGEFGSHLQVAGWMVGPQVYHHFLGGDFFAHGLFGQGSTHVDIGTPLTSAGRAIAGGGGVDFPISERFSIRAIEADYIDTQTFNSSEKSLRLSTGLVFRWGAIKKNRGSRKMPSP
jgi:hypothetical protein